MSKNEKVEKLVNFDIIASFFIGHFLVLEHMGRKLAPDMFYNNIILKTLYLLPLRSYNVFKKMTYGHMAAILDFGPVQKVIFYTFSARFSLY